MINVNQIVLLAEGYMKEGHDMERAIVEACSKLNIDLDANAQQKVREGLSRHAEAVGKQNEANQERTEEMAEQSPEVPEVPEEEPAENDADENEGE